jgi:hypothetical protein
MFLSTNESMQKLSLLLVDNNKNNVIELAITKTLLLLPNQFDLVCCGKHIFAVKDRSSPKWTNFIGKSG